MTQIAQLERAFIAAGPRGLTRREVERLGVPARFVTARMGDLASRRRMRTEESRFRGAAVTGASTGGSTSGPRARSPSRRSPSSLCCPTMSARRPRPP
jgi:hypothetical protein